METKYSIDVQQRPDEDFKRYYPEYWGSYIGAGAKLIEEWRSFENPFKPEIIWFKNEEDARGFIEKQKELNKKPQSIERIIIE
jgi:hypothetical protein